MPVRTRSHDGDVMDYRAEILEIREELHDLRDLKGEIAEIKQMLISMGKKPVVDDVGTSTRGRPSGTPFDQWVNLATTHCQGRAATWLENVGIPWQLMSWMQLCDFLKSRFSTESAHDAVEMLQNMKQGTMTVNEYIDKFETCVRLVRRDHNYLKENFLMSCFISGLIDDIKYDVIAHKPFGILDTYWFCRVEEKSAAATKAQNFQKRQYTQPYVQNYRQQPANPNPNQPQLRNAPPKAPPNTKNTCRPERAEKKCYYCTAHGTMSTSAKLVPQCIYFRMRSLMKLNLSKYVIQQIKKLQNKQLQHSKTKCRKVQNLQNS